MGYEHKNLPHTRMKESYYTKPRQIVPPTTARNLSLILNLAILVALPHLKPFFVR